MSCKVKVISQRTVCHQTNGALALSTQLVTLKIVTTGHRSLLCFIYMVVHGGGGVFHVCGTCVVVVVVVQGGQWWPDVLVTPVASGDLCPRQQEARHCSHPPPTRGRKTSRGRKSSNNFDVTSTFQHVGTENLLMTQSQLV